MYTAELPEAQQIYDELILALLDEFRKIRETPPNLSKKHVKHKLGLCMRSMFLLCVHSAVPEIISHLTGCGTRGMLAWIEFQHELYTKNLHAREIMLNQALNFRYLLLALSLINNTITFVTTSFI